MIYQVYSYRDQATKAFTKPILELDTPENYVERMSRAFATEAEKYHVRSRDLVLYHLGTYDDQKALFMLNDEPALLLRVDDVEWIGGRYNVDETKPTA